MKKVCLLTGAAGALGTAFCQRYRDRYHIVAVYHQREPQVASQRQHLVDPLAPAAALAENEHPIYTVQADLLDDRDLVRVVDIALARHDRIDLLINGAAELRFLGPLWQCDRWADRMERQMRLNVLVPIRLAAEVANRFWRTRTDNKEAGRNVINVSSVSGLYVYPNEGQGTYSASKAALNYLTCHLAHDLLPMGVRVNGLAPTSFPARIATEQVAEALVRLDEGDLTGKVMELSESGERATN